MAADILLYGAQRVPVGGDQSQHVELTRDLAVRFNTLYGPTFVVPELEPTALTARVLDLQDPTRKMSKSDSDDAAGVVRLLDTPDVIRRKFRRAVTDSEGEVRYDPHAKPGVSNLLDILAALTGQGPVSLATTITGYGQLKDAVADAVIAELRPLQERHDELVADRPELARLLDIGRQRARETSTPVLDQAQQAMGITR